MEITKELNGVVAVNEVIKDFFSYKKKYESCKSRDKEFLIEKIKEELPYWEQFIIKNKILTNFISKYSNEKIDEKGNIRYDINSKLLTRDENLKQYAGKTIQFFPIKYTNFGSKKYPDWYVTVLLQDID